VRVVVIAGWLLVLFVLLWPFFRRWLARLPRRPRGLRDELVKDPVCEAYVLRSRAHTRTVGGKTYYFCSSKCAASYTGLGERA
jgi:YHS domain-containing protein